MDELNSVNLDGVSAEAARRRYRLSWVAYLWPTFWFLFHVGLGYLLTLWSLTAGLVWMGLALGIYVLRFLGRRAVRLFMDSRGVWLYGGLFPWSRGISGVKWRDVDEASYATWLVPWLTKSYAIRVGHRYTKTGEIFVAHIKDGDKAVQAINEVHLRLIEMAEQVRSQPHQPPEPEAVNVPYVEVLP